MHKAMYCTCGRLAHFPKHARHGYTWVCWSCGSSWTIVPRGTGDGSLAKIPSTRSRRRPKVITVPMPVPMPVSQPVVVQVQPALSVNPFIPQQGGHLPPPPAMRQLPPPRRGGLLGWLFGG